MKTVIKINDMVKVISGKNKGQKGKVIQILPEEYQVVVEGANKMFKNIRSRKQGDKGQRIEFSAPLNISKVMLLCPKCDRPTRLSIVVDGDAKKRVCKKCKAPID